MTKSASNWLTDNARILVYLFVLSFILVNQFQVSSLWGFNLLGFTPPSFSYIVFAIILVLLIPAVSKKLLDILDTLSMRFSNRKENVALFYLITSILLSLLVLEYHSTIPLLGDGSLRANEIHDGRMWQPTEMLDFLTHAIVFQNIFQPAGLSATESYRVISALSGLLFVAGILRLSLYLNRKKFLTLFLLMLSSGMTVMFFGYVESYSMIAALLPFVFLSGLKTIDGKGNTLCFLGLYVLSLLVHSIAVVIFSGVVIIVILWKTTNPSFLTRVHKWSFAVPVCALVVGYVARFSGSAFFERYLIPIIPDETYSISFFSADHVLNIVNWLLLSALPFAVLLPSLFSKSTDSDQQDSLRRFYVFWMILPSLIFVLFFVPQIGGFRDWDLFSLPIFILVLSVLTYYLKYLKRPLTHHVIPIIVMSLSITGSFAYLNSSTSKAVDRFIDGIEVTKFHNLYIEYATLFNHSKNRTELSHRSLEFALKAWEQPPRNASDSLYMGTELAIMMIGAGNRSMAFDCISALMKVDTLELNNYKLFIEFNKRFGTKEDLHRVAQAIDKRFQDNPQGMMEAGVTYLNGGHLEEGGRCLERAYDLDHDDLMIVVNYGNYLLLTETFDRAIDVFESELKNGQSNFTIYFGLATACFHKGAEDKAYGYLGSASMLAETESDKQKVRTLEEMFNSN